MEFDKSRVYTAVNADELKIGSKCFFADSLGELRSYVEGDCTEGVLKEIVGENEEERFISEQGSWWHLAYLIEPPAEPKYKPFESVEEAMKAIKAHGGWIKYNVSASYSLVIEYGSGSIYTNGKCMYMQDLLDDYVFADDGSPCGVLIEE